MQIEIVNHFTNTGKEFFRFELYDGPDGIEDSTRVGGMVESGGQEDTPKGSCEHGRLSILNEQILFGETQ